MCEKCEARQDRSMMTVEERLADLERKQFILLQATHQLIGGLDEAKAELDSVHKAFQSFLLRMMKLNPELVTEFAEYVEKRAANVGEADQVMTALLDKLNMRPDA